MSEQQFQRYWIDVHAVQYASKIPQIRKYMLDFRVPFGPESQDPPWSGVAEIWLRNDQEQLESLQTPEFLEGARIDEPRWAAFWRTLVLDTDAHLLVPGPEAGEPKRRKLITLVKRQEGISLPEFREQSLGKYAELVAETPGVRRYLQGHTRDGAYAIGEAVLDAAYQVWFDDEDSLAAAMDSPEYRRAEEHLHTFVQPRYIHRMMVDEHWIIGPESR
ncbi:MAG: EthD domain-containing protein [Pseudonocardiaceae bacterium]